VFGRICSLKLRVAGHLACRRAPATDRSQDGFEFSIAEIYRLPDRNNRAEEAQQLVKPGSNPFRKAA
jgi:hypothetical protein